MGLMLLFLQRIKVTVRCLQIRSRLIEQELRSVTCVRACK